MRHRITKIVLTIAMLLAIATLVLVAIGLLGSGGKGRSLPGFLRTMGESASTDASAQQAAESCPATPQPVADPVRMTLIGHDLDLPMISVGMDATGTAPATPPDNEGYTVAWFDEGPLIGSALGNAVLSSHTFRYGGALGNQLIKGLLTPGDIVKISGSDGSAACYRYSGSTHVMVAEYDNSSNVLYDDYGDPQFALIVCSDYDSEGVALGRMIYYGDLITDDLDASHGAAESTSEPTEG